jgi:hypothetical protein
VEDVVVAFLARVEGVAELMLMVGVEYGLEELAAGASAADFGN